MTSKFHLDGELLSKEQTERLQDALCGIASSDKELSVEVCLVSEEEIRRLNHEQRNIDRVTDVLSFPSMELNVGEEIMADEHGEELDEEDRLFLGSVAVCEKRAREQAEEFGHSFERELCYLIVHGVLHCLGYDHEAEEDKRRMREMEEKVLKELSLSREEL